MMLSILLGLAPAPLPLLLPPTTPLVQTINSPQQEEQLDDYDQVIQYYQPKRASAETLLDMMNVLIMSGGMEHKTRVGEDNFNFSRPLVMTYGNSLLVKDTRKEIARTFAMLTDLDENYRELKQAKAQRSEQPQLFQYTFTHISLDSARIALRSLYDAQRRAGGQPGDPAPPQLSFVDEQGQILVRGTVEQIAEVHDILKKLDVPRPHITLSFFLIQGCAEEDNDDRVPLDLSRDLGELVPFAGFKLLSSAIVPSDGSGQIQLDVQLEDDRGTVNLELTPAAYDATAGTLALERAQVLLHLSENGRNSTSAIRTSTSLEAGRYTVLGAVGADPVFMVIKLSKPR